MIIGYQNDIIMSTVIAPQLPSTNIDTEMMTRDYESGLCAIETESGGVLVFDMRMCIKIEEERYTSILDGGGASMPVPCVASRVISN